MNYLWGFLILLSIAFPVSVAGDDRPAWGYKCVNNYCKKVAINEETIQTAISLSVCRMFCGDDIGTLWPKPTGDVTVKNYVMQIDPDQIRFRTATYRKYWTEMEDRFKQQIKAMIPKNTEVNGGGRTLLIEILMDNDEMELTTETDESYKMTGKIEDHDIYTKIVASTYFGARHALETLSQLIVYDDIRNEIQAIAEFDITDAPKYKHRGLLLDTSRNFFSKESIKRTIDAMAMVKMNVFHWHITDSHSFPIVIRSHPELSKYGAYARSKIYTPEDVAEIVSYAKVRGVRVIPEFDAPAHVGEGWQKKNLTTCFNYQPWQSYCVEPPCGQFDPSKDKLYDILEDIYREYVEMFGAFDIFHMGGDEVSVSCWNSSKELQSWMQNKGWGLEEKDFMKLWGYFQENALARFDKVSKSKTLIPIILWTSRLTEEPFLTQYLDKDRYIIQIWTKGDDPKLETILNNGYKVIVSNYDGLYLDCGFSAWVTEGNNWCSPYIGWQKVYSNKMSLIAPDHLDQVMGAEAALWTEQVDEWALDSKLWPRVSALAERLWTDPEIGWRNAESRMLVNRRRLVENGIQANRLQPEWCLQNEGECPI
jgi:hexosaminidase